MNTILLPLLLLCSATPKIEAKVVYVDAKNKFVVIGKGKADGLGADYTYDIVRKVGDETVVIGTCRFEKYLGARETMCKLLMDDDTVDQVRVDDLVVCRRKG
jgi:hypothetical protein